MPIHRWLIPIGLFFWLTISALGLKAQTPGLQTNPMNCPEPALNRIKKHLVAAGETLESIASEYNLIPATLMGLNPSLRQGEVRMGMEIFIPPYNGIRVEVPEGKTWQDVAAEYNVRPALVYEVNGCQENPREVFLPGVNWSPVEGDVPLERYLTGYPLPSVAPLLFGFGWKVHPVTRKVVFHSGLDLQANVGTPVLAVGDGTVAFADERGDYGNLVVVNHEEGLQTRYAHLDRITVLAGEKIKKGTQLGTVGSTGNPDSPQPHLHFEVRYNSDLGWVAEDPLPYIQAILKDAIEPVGGRGVGNQNEQ